MDACPRTRHRARRRLRNAADEVWRRPAGGDEGLDAERPRCRQPTRGALVVRWRRTDGRGRGRSDPGQRYTVRGGQALLRRRESLNAFRTEPGTMRLLLVWLV